MKFGKRLQSQIDETLPEWRDKYLSYKQLKKRLKLISAPECFTEAAFSSPEREAGTTMVLPPVQPAPPEEVILAGRAAVSDGGSAAAPVLSDGQDSSVHGGDKSSSGSADGAISECVLHPELGASELSVEEADFIHLLNAELEKFNTFFVEKEEEYVIRLQELKERCERFKEKRSTCDRPYLSLNEERINMKKDIVNFHGEMVLLLNYSSLNYTGLVKILKKHDKRTGALLRMPFIRSVLQQPFFTTELLSKLVRECEENLQSLFPLCVERVEEPAINVPSANAEAKLSQPQSQQPVVDEKAEGLSSHKEKEDVTPPIAPQTQAPTQGEDVDNIYRSTLAALRTIKELRRGSSTYSIFSLPPFNKGVDDDDDVDGTLHATSTPVCGEK